MISDPVDMLDLPRIARFHIALVAWRKSGSLDERATWTEVGYLFSFQDRSESLLGASSISGGSSEFRVLAKLVLHLPAHSAVFGRDSVSDRIFPRHECCTDVLCVSCDFGDVSR